MTKLERIATLFLAAVVVLAVSFQPAHAQVHGRPNGGGSSGGASIGGAVTGANDKSVLFTHPAATLAQDANFTYDTTNQQLIVPVGTAANPAYSFTGFSSWGFFKSAAGSGELSVSISGVVNPGWNSLGFVAPGTKYIGFTSDTTDYQNVDVTLFRDAANILAQRNGTNAQTFRVYQTFTDASNYGRVGISYDGVNAWRILTEQAGTGSNTNLDLGTNNASKWRINTSGHFIAIADNTNDIGASGTTRPRTIYVGTSIQDQGAANNSTPSIGIVTSGNGLGAGTNGDIIIFGASNVPTMWGGISPTVRSDAALSWSSTTSYGGTVDKTITRRSAGLLLTGANSTAMELSTTQTTAPTCTTNCGTSPSVAGSDTAGIVTMGASGSPASGWVVTFNGTWAAAPSCIVQSALGSMVVGKMPIAVATTTTTMTVTTNGTAPANSDKYQYVCVGVS